MLPALNKQNESLTIYRLLRIIGFPADPGCNSFLRTPGSRAGDRFASIVMIPVLGGENGIYTIKGGSWNVIKRI